MDSLEIMKDLRNITSVDCKFESIGVFADAFENIVDIFPNLDPFLQFELAKEVMKIECSMNHQSYEYKHSMKTDINTDGLEHHIPQAILDLSNNFYSKKDGEERHV